MSLTGAPDSGPNKAGIPIADLAAGMFAAYAVAAALYERERSGQGQVIDTSMLGGQVALLSYQAGAYFATGKPPGRVGNRHSQIAPYETFATADGYVNVGVANEALWGRFCEAIGLADLRHDPRFATNGHRVTHREALVGVVGPPASRRRTLGPDLRPGPGLRRPAGGAPGPQADRAASARRRVDDARPALPPVAHPRRRAPARAPPRRAHRRRPRRPRLRPRRRCRPPRQRHRVMSVCTHP
jgi:hypothetical protein